MRLIYNGTNIEVRVGDRTTHVDWLQQVRILSITEAGVVIACQFEDEECRMIPAERRVAPSKIGAYAIPDTLNKKGIK